MDVILENPVVHAIGWALLQFVWQGALIAAVTGIAFAALVRRDPRVRYGIGILSLVLMLALPIGTAVRSYEGGGASPGAVAIEPAPGPAHPSAEPAGIAEPVSGSVPSVSAPTRGAGFTSAWPDLEAWLPGLVLAWLLGVAALSLRMVGGCLVTARLRRRGVTPRPDLTGTVARMAHRLRLSGPVRILESAVVEVPAVVGWIRPVILLPASAAAGLSPAQLEAVLAHELAHVRRHDYLVNLVQTAVETLLFYHPGVWWVSNRVRAEREQCADDLAVAACGNAVVYAGALSELERARTGAAALAMTATGGSLVHRVRRVLGQPIAREGRSPAWLATLLTTGLIFALALGASETTVVATPGEEITEILTPARVPEEPGVSLTTEAPEVGTEVSEPVEAEEQVQVLEARSPLSAAQVVPVPPQPFPATAGPPAQVVPVLPQPFPATAVSAAQAVPQPAPSVVLSAGQNQIHVLSSNATGWLGLMIEDGQDRGVRVEDVEEDSPAAEAGIETGDLITEYNGTNVLGAVQFQRLVGETPVGRTVSVRVSRNGQPRDLSVTVASRPAPATIFGLDRYTDFLDRALVSPGGFDYAWNLGGAALGLTVETMTPDLREFFGADRNAGVLVVEISDDSIAGEAGVRVGDVIVAADGNRVDSPSGLRSLTQAVLASGNSVTLSVVRDRSERDVVVEPQTEAAPNVFRRSPGGV